MQRIEVVRNSDPLNREVWVFWYDDRHHALVLDRYTKASRPSTRHRKWEASQSYERIGRRRGEDNISP
jgi:hypothetical protein